MKRLLDIWSRYVNQFDTVENWSNSVTYSCSQIKLLKDNIKEFGTDPVISSVRGSAANYKPQDPEFYRKLYKEKAMPFLRLESATPIETEKTIAELNRQLKERDKQIDTIRVTIDKIQPLVEFVNSFETPQKLKRILDEFFEDGKFRTWDEEPTLLDEDVAEMIDDAAEKRGGLTQKETLEQMMKEELKKIEESEKKLKELARKSGMPMTRKEYEERKKKRATK